MKQLVMYVGPAGSGKSSEASGYEAIRNNNFVRISQDDQGKEGHFRLFLESVVAGKNIVIDRMNFNKEQRNRYLTPAKECGYYTRIIVLHESYQTCLDRCLKRKDHPTIKDETNARAALHTFFSKYERVTDDEADQVDRRWPYEEKPSAIICDLDGTLCDVTHRRHFVRRERKKDWAGFFQGIKDDRLNQWCKDILIKFNEHKVVLCSGRGQEYQEVTTEWLNKFDIQYDDLFMRMKRDSRQDFIVKEIILDFEILTRYKPYFMIDDRDQVVKMWRDRGFVCLQCDNGAF